MARLVPYSLALSRCLLPSYSLRLCYRSSWSRSQRSSSGSCHSRHGGCASCKPPFPPAPWLSHTASFPLSHSPSVTDRPVGTVPSSSGGCCSRRGGCTSCRPPRPASACYPWPTSAPPSPPESSHRARLRYWGAAGAMWACVTRILCRRRLELACMCSSVLTSTPSRAESLMPMPSNHRMIWTNCPQVFSGVRLT